MLQYFWQSEQWPHYRWRADDILGPLAELRKAQGRVLGQAAGLGFDESLNASALTLEEDAIQTAAIEGEQLNREKVRSSVALRLGLPQASLSPVDRAVDGLVEVLLDATRHNVLLKTRFWQKHSGAQINERQQKVVNRLLDVGLGGFEGGLSTRKYMSLTKSSLATAWREINNLGTV